MAHWCPKKEIRVFPENCKAICPKQWPERLTVTSEGRLRCIFENIDEKALSKNKLYRFCP